MKLISFSDRDRSSYGIAIGDQICDLGRRLTPEHPSLRWAVASGALDVFCKANPKPPTDLRFGDVTLLPPIPDPDKIVCIGRNYRGHAAEAGVKIPANPALFIRLTNTLVASGTPMICPRVSASFDYEGELAIIIGKGGRHIPEASALDHVLGYACFHDGSIRDYQFEHSLSAGKNFPATAGIGPWIVTADEIPDVSKLTLSTRLNGVELQRAGLHEMVFGVAAMVAYVSTWTPLLPGDVIGTGTPDGVGFTRKPPIWMKPGDVAEVEITNIGVLRNPIAAET